MKLSIVISLVFLAIAGFVFFALCDDDQGDLSVGSPTVTDAYFGEQEPGRTLRLFAPRILGSNLHTPQIFSSDGASAYWCTMDGREILVARFEDGAWQAPEPISFSSASVSPDSPFLSADGECLYFEFRGHKTQLVEPRDTYPILFQITVCVPLTEDAREMQVDVDCRCPLRAYAAWRRPTDVELL